MSNIDISALQEFVGREEMRADQVHQSAVDQFRNTLGPYLLAETVEFVPPGFHWTLFQPVAPTDDLGSDGHPKSLGILPEMPLPSRMWAGGDVALLAPFQIGGHVQRKTRVEKIETKSGSSGPLLFITLAHETSSDQTMMVREKQHLVYRTPAPPSPPKGAAIGQSEGLTFETDPRLLFRYSALTFNSHRIHYDQDYARNVEGYRDLVVHGPLQATMMLNYIAGSLGHARLGMRYRGVAPLYVHERATVCRSGDTSGRVWVERYSGQLTMTGEYGAPEDLGQ
ncbi:MAG: hypothetical protein RH945_03040 [Hyphomonas sp.]